MKNGGILGVTTGVQEAAARAGWDVRVLDSAGLVQSRTAAFGQALALQPAGIIINGFDAIEQQAALDQAAGAGIPMVSWHADPPNGQTVGRIRSGSCAPLQSCRKPHLWRHPSRTRFSCTRQFPP